MPYRGECPIAGRALLRGEPCYGVSPVGYALSRGEPCCGECPIAGSALSG